MPNFMTFLPRRLVACSLFAYRAESSVGPIPHHGRQLARAARMVSFAGSESWPGCTTFPPPRAHADIHAASGFRAEGCCRLAESKTRQKRHAADLPAVRLRGHGQDHAGAPY